MSDRFDALILGCGFLGRFLLPRFAGRVIAVTRSGRPAGTAADPRVEWFALDLAAADGTAALQRAVGRFSGHAWLLVPPSGLPEGDDAQVFARLREALRAIGVRRAVMASSTGVYGDHGGSEVTSRTLPAPATPRERRLLELERLWLAGDDAARVVRLGGLYGPGRVIGLNAAREGQVLPGAGDDWLNLVRAEDAAAALIATAFVERAERVGLATDGTPVRRAEYYGYLAQAVGGPAPAFGGGVRRGGSRRCNPASTWAALGLAPAYPDYRHGLQGLL